MTEYTEVGIPDLQPFFWPWMGKEYRQRLLEQNASSPRIHLMAESHYSKETPDPSWTVDAVRELALAQNKFGAFWTKAIQIVERKPGCELDRLAAWNRVAYSNFIQDNLHENRKAPNSEMWERGRRTFFAQLALTRPSILIVLGKRLFAQLPNEGMRIPGPLREQPDSAPVEDAWLYPHDVEGERILTLAVCVTHPSGGGFQWETASGRAWSAISHYSSIATAYRNGTFSKPVRN